MKKPLIFIICHHKAFHLRPCWCLQEISQCPAICLSPLRLGICITMDAWYKHPCANETGEPPQIWPPLKLAYSLGTASGLGELFTLGVFVFILDLVSHDEDEELKESLIHKNPSLPPGFDFKPSGGVCCCFIVLGIIIVLGAAFYLYKGPSINLPWWVR